VALRRWLVRDGISEDAGRLILPGRQSLKGALSAIDAPELQRQIDRISASVLGPRQDPGSPYAAVIPLFAKAAMAGLSPLIHGDGEQTRDFTFIDNAVLANLLAASAPAEKVSGEVFNVGCGDRISVNQLWEEIRSVLGVSVEATHGPPRPGDVQDSLASLDHITQRTGYQVRVDLKTGIRRTVEWLGVS
jgi:nucleoside-diphosphate-sugar epimerase